MIKRSNKVAIPNQLSRDIASAINYSANSNSEEKKKVK